MIDRERFIAERDSYLEHWQQPVTIQFGAVFHHLVDPRQAMYSYGIVTDIRSPEAGLWFKAGTLVRGLIDDEGNLLPDQVGGGGDAERSMIVGMTGEILTVDQYIDGLRQGSLQRDNELETWLQEYRTVLEALKAKGARELPGEPMDDQLRNYVYYE